ncbi:2-amino-4-hydroxy-6-hydroxymethyldihydropteridine diphosphokinase [Sporosarcina thermotolerans]|uniref:2-amino-4-hydroxy-6-hydroxymethyldihydropteridine diphosphokinase n=1 Tax=Sporosarcina thermotolerans TaxID=633404 RepID=A0AAW9AEX2_9BACL|nr:2-amino-4-hydroxy-6-hydroxymethyldihydropteridine diphosphokinase [Sporosarcina thermotolerans]MDW0118720.1 2-amino-4-hydroxy-6-hydroxymethyldihydropteridine diphosphokinase [Sporosarcina thermotolerans]WHT48638.1 2-amino-4-hydroxy-6-hydroxymethyldihydropteridine diphosphokinase [Sporosarcina thermotolerans]
MNIAYLSIGSNIGDRLQHLTEAVRLLHLHDEIEVTGISSVYETEPVGYTNQANFLNLVVRLETSLNPFELLGVCQGIENDLGRVREIRWGPRTVDLDILLYNNDNIESENLTVPHPRMDERAFVLVPLMEIAPNLVGVPIDDGGVIRWRKVEGVEHFLNEGK